MNTADPHSGRGAPSERFPRRLRQRQAALADWPEPDATARQHSLRLIEAIREQIAAAGGAIPFHDYMQAALYTPGLGYYAAGSSKFGAAGDFVTAPEISSLFAECLAEALSPVLNSRPDWDLLEAGAGSGILAARLLQEWQAQDCLPRHYYILELSGDLRERQQQQIAQHCPELLPRVQWLQGWPDDFNGIVLANELLDAMPVHRVHKRAGQWYEQTVGFEQDGFVSGEQPSVNEALQCQLAAIEEPQPLPDDYLSEINLDAAQWIESLGEQMQQGIVLLLDYGYPRHEYYHPQRQRGTLMCHYRHRAHDDPFVYPGLQDITAHVDFTHVADSALAAGFGVAGYTTQAHFLLDAGLMQRLEQHGGDEADYLQCAGEVRRLTLPQEMGEIFKVMLLNKGSEVLPKGFGGRDLRHQL
ncbi:class I SAM-dependent methyltransferase [Thiohalophilus thiocyanatoxydans]|uniref:SAM-dependent MidA family methyltransferase n=1 Tax=Thiohalophilus thiocyanatoxydans TaxID=381308 RepID=A0A4R8IEZ6_9GAMM|nr:SAM-dependent methyltransferase [Thiohalophilus thiocyanatoxydans]TDX98169.1 SAM-dependent MidA family methyltransferase [Thiohalophilus thiocyanatoxydans]